MEKLFLFEVLVEKIEFMESYVNYSKADVIITTTFGNVLRLDIQLDKSDENYRKYTEYDEMILNKYF